MDKIDEALQRKMSIDSLMSSAGMRVLKADMADDMMYADNEIDKMKKGYISDQHLCKLNYNLGIKSGLEMVLNRLANYEDELVGENVKSQK